MTVNIRQTILIAVLFFGLLLTSSAFNRTSPNTNIGKTIPEIANEDISLALKQCESEGKYILVNFWSASDGLSRQSANVYTSWVARHGDDRVDLLSVNFDKSEALFREVVRHDGLNEKMQFNVSGYQARRIMDEFHLHDGYGTLLIAPDGEIIAHNPTTRQLERLRPSD